MSFKQPLLAVGVLLSGASFNASATLTSYTGADNVGLVYSSVSNVTWTQDANLFKTLADSYAGGTAAFIDAVIGSVGGKISDSPNYYDTPSNSGFRTLTSSDFNPTTGSVTWFGAQAYVGYLNRINYGGSNQWRLPTAGNPPQAGYNQTGGELGQLFYSELKGTANNAMPNTNTFGNEQDSYWSGTESVQTKFANAWDFYAYDGYQGSAFKNNSFQLYAWAVSPGQATTVPVPGALWLFGTGLLGLVSLKRRGYAG